MINHNSRSGYCDCPVTYISFDFEGRYNHSGEIRECGITVLRIDNDTIGEIRNDPTRLPTNTQSCCLRVSEFQNDRIPGWAWGKGLQPKKFKFGSQTVTRVPLTNLNSEMMKIVDKERARNVPIRLVVHAAENEEKYCRTNKISAFNGLWEGLIDTQVEWRHLDPKHRKPGLANLTDNFLNLDSSMVHNAGNDSCLTMLLIVQLIRRALSL